MSRRDTIIVAVLVNAALLIALFFTANRYETTEEVTVAAAPVPQQIPSQIVEAPLPLQEIDQVLTEYAALPTAGEEIMLDEEFDFEPVITVVEPPKPEPIPMQTISVQRGDSLDKLAKRHGCTVRQIIETNQLSSTVLQIGQKLKLPGEGVEESSPALIYTVQEGDNPWLIAARNHIKLEELLRINGLDESKARRLRPGDQLRLR